MALGRAELVLYGNLADANLWEVHLLHQLMFAPLLLAHTVSAHDGGVVVWAHGRSATDTFAGSLMLTAGWDYCKGEKEAFKENGPTAEELKTCFEDHERLTHVKPNHIHSQGELRNSSQFFDAAKSAGFTVVAAVYRSNALNRMVSSFELSAKHITDKAERCREAKELFCSSNNTRHLRDLFLDQRRELLQGINDAERRGFKVIQLSFEDVIFDTCDSVSRTLEFISPKLASNPCVVFSSPHVKTSHHNATLEDRVGRVAYDCIREELEDDPTFAWMLTPHLEHPPCFDSIQPPKKSND